MKVEVRLCADTEVYIFKNLYPLYVHDLSSFSDVLPNPHGILEPDPNLRSLTEQGDSFDYLWQQPESLFPYLIWVDDLPAGLCVVGKKPYASEEIDQVLFEFFVLGPFRKKGVGLEASRQIFRLSAGRWELSVLPRNLRVLNFWRKVLQEYENLEETKLEGEIRFRFRS